MHFGPNFLHKGPNVQSQRVITLRPIRAKEDVLLQAVFMVAPEQCREFELSFNRRTRQAEPRQDATV